MREYNNWKFNLNLSSNQATQEIEHDQIQIERTSTA